MSPQTLLRPQLRKSKRGCRTCKLRKVKCDEAKPLCGNCARRYTNIQSCDFDSPSKTEKPTKGIDRKTLSVSWLDLNTIPSSINLRPIGLEGDIATRSFELRLMHHYTTHACFDLPNCHGEPAEYVWQIKVPQLAFNYNPALDSILAISALHLQALLSHDQTLATVCTKYINTTVKGHQRAFSSSAADDCTDLSEPVFLTSLVTSITAWLMSHRAIGREQYTLPLQAFHMAREAQGMFQSFQSKPSLIGKVDYSWFNQEEVVILPIADDHQPGSRLLKNVQQDLTLLNEKATSQFPLFPCDSDNSTIYHEATSFLLWLYTAFVSGTSHKFLHRFIVTMPIRLSPEFLHLLSKQDPFAMALLARDLVLLRLLDHAWWIDGGGDYEVLRYDIQGICELMPLDCLWMMDWPLGILYGDDDHADKLE